LPSCRSDGFARQGLPRPFTPQMVTGGNTMNLPIK
jgi:hypothetical protein